MHFASCLLLRVEKTTTINSVSLNYSILWPNETAVKKQYSCEYSLHGDIYMTTTMSIDNQFSDYFLPFMIDETFHQ